jgi:hypothetical protein
MLTISILSKHGARHLLAAVTLALVMGVAPTAFARGFGVRVDCRGNGGNPSWSASNDTISVMVLIRDKWEKVAAKKMSACGDDNSQSFYVDAFEATDIKGIALVNFGKDTFWVDDLEIWYGNFQHLAWSWGVDNNVGVCLSAQASDGDSAHCYNGTAYTVFQKTMNIPYLLAPAG